jgi:hypothetical protein
LIATAAVGPPTALATAYVYSCGSGGQWVDWTTVDRTFTSNLATGAILNVTVRTLRPCTSPNGSDYSFPAAGVLTLEGGTDEIVQLAYLVCGVPGGCGNGIPNDGKPHFVWTRADNAGGEVHLFDTWYHAPVAGHEYRFKILATSSAGNNIWQYCIRDYNTEPSYSCHNGGHLDGSGNFVLSRSWTSSSFAWYGTETQNTESQNGTGAGEASLNIRWMQYYRGGVWSVVSDQAGCVKTTEVIYPAHYDCSIVSTVDVDGDGVVNDKETLRSFTDLH